MESFSGKKGFVKCSKKKVTIWRELAEAYFSNYLDFSG